MSFRFHDCQYPLNQCFRLLYKTSPNIPIWHSAWRCVRLDDFADHFESRASIVEILTAFLERGGGPTAGQNRRSSATSFWPTPLTAKS
jgi:hypothetical protein